MTNNDISFHENNVEPWKITLLDTGEETGKLTFSGASVGSSGLKAFSNQVPNAAEAVYGSMDSSNDNGVVGAGSTTGSWGYDISFGDIQMSPRWLFLGLFGWWFFDNEEPSEPQEPPPVVVESPPQHYDTYDDGSSVGSGSGSYSFGSLI